MKFRVEVISVNEEGSEQRRDVMEMEREGLAMETLGLSLAEGKAILRGVQDFVASQQTSEDLRRRRRCPNCGQRHHSKAAGTSTVETVFGPVGVPNPRWERCPCQPKGPKTFRPTATWLQGRTSPERLYLESKWGSLIPYEKVADLLKEVLPVSSPDYDFSTRWAGIAAGSTVCLFEEAPIRRGSAPRMACLALPAFYIKSPVITEETRY
jgi:hypothetical protein